MVLDKEKLIKHLNKLIEMDNARALKETTSDTQQTVITARISAHM